jgi:DNA-binding response OmpR family regulator
MATILVIEDDPAIVLGLQEAITAEGFSVLVERDGEGGLRQARREVADCILLDVMLPLMNGRDVCRTLRAEGVNTPIIMLTAKAEEADVVLGLEIGADDYVTKPFRLNELLARVRALLRRRSALAKQADSKLEFGLVTVDFETMELRVNGELVRASVRELEVLHFLVKHEGEVVSRDMLLDSVWGYDHYPTTRTVDNYILSLRKKIEPNAANPTFIRTVHTAGYRFTREETKA